MPRKYIASYKKMASKRGFQDPLEYLWRQYEAMRKAERHPEAIELAQVLLPYGHGKRAPVDDTGDTVAPAVISLE